MGRVACAVKVFKHLVFFSFLAHHAPPFFSRSASIASAIL
jgi:hypothetical protein